MVSVVSFSLQEEYGSGWTGTAVLQVADTDGNVLNVGQILGVMLEAGIEAGVPVKLHFFSVDDDGVTTLVRTWPCMVNLVEPFFVKTGSEGATEKFCRICLVDPVTYLADQPVWGSYRSTSLGEMVGGVLSMAAGGDGKPTLQPVLPGLPGIEIVSEVRTGLRQLPFILAAGHTLGQWLGDVFGGLGIRAHLRGEEDGTFRLILSDQPPTGDVLEMNPRLYDIEPETAASLNSSTLLPATLVVLGYASYPSTPARGLVIDNPVLGTPVQTGSLGTNDSVLLGTGVDTDEAYSRMSGALFGEFAEMFRVSVLTVAPAVQPGQLIQTTAHLAFALTAWQTVRAAHHLHRDGTYHNDATLMIGSPMDSWQPPRPRPRPPVYITGVIDAGNDYAVGQQVPRDRLGRIHVTFPFRAAPTGEERKQIDLSDSDGNQRITLEDFEPEQVSDYRENQEQWQEKADAYSAGEYQDPYPGRDDSDLSDEELSEREEKRESREAAIGYMAYQRADSLDQMDVDRDGVVSDRDRLLEEEFPDLAYILRDDKSRTQLERLWESMRAGTLEEDDPTAFLNPATRALIARYGHLFHEPEEEEEEEEEEDLEDQEGDPAPAEAMEDATEQELISEEDQARFAAVRRDAVLAGERWPPRIPLSLSGLMAGHMHGFIPGHRQGDICRVVVYNPFSAEIVGFQYRSNRLISPDLTQALAGLVVEHNYGEAWSGIVFRPTEQLEDDVTSRIAVLDEDAAESGTDT